MYGLATVGSQTGLVILPDEWTLPTGVTFTGLTYTTRKNGFSRNTYTTEQWSALQLAGAVFLPAARVRDSTKIIAVRDYGYYWSSTAAGVGGACDIYFFDGGYLYDENTDLRYYGLAVRLVR